MKSGSTLIIIAAILWGVDGLLRRSLYDLMPITIVFYEHLLGAVLITPFAIKAIKLEKFTPAEKIIIVIISLLSGLLGTLWFTKALISSNFAPFSIVFLLQKLQPIFAIAAARIILKEKLTPHYIKWALLAITAAYFVTFKNGQVNWQQDLPLITTALFAIGAAFAWGSSTALSKYNLQSHSQTSITALRFLITTVIAGVVIVFTNPAAFGPITPNHLAKLLMITFSTGLVALWLYYKGLKSTKAQVSTILELAFPLTGVIIDGFVYHSSLAASQYVAAGILIFAITKLSHRTSK